MTNTHTHREAWLGALTERFRDWFREVADYPLPPRIRLSCGFASRGALKGNRNTTLGQCWHGEASGDGAVEIFISPITADPLRVADILGHELIHAACGKEVGHKGMFRTLALEMGLEGKMTATVGGEHFRWLVRPWLEALGPYPHAELDAKAGPPKQATRLIKVSCGHCGYSVRITRKWLDEAGPPCCPEHGGPLEE